MANHFQADTGKKITTPREWLKVGAEVGTLVNKWAKRGDLIAMVGKDAGRGVAPALYDPKTAEIEVNTDIVFGETMAEDIGDMNDRDEQFEHPKAAGAILHEAMHARFTTWSLEDAAKTLSGSENRALHVLEESRIEGHGVRVFPENRSFLRACAMEIVIGDLTDESMAQLTQTRQAAHSAALTMGRVTAGVLDKADVASTEKVVMETLGADLVGKLKNIWTEFQGINDPTKDPQLEKMYRLAREWDRLVQEAAEENGEGGAESDPDNQGEGGDGSGSSSAGGSGQELTDEQKEALGDMIKAMMKDGAKVEIRARGEAADQKTTEEYKAAAEAASADEREQKENQDTASDVFNHASGPLSGRTRSRLVNTRRPTSEERVAAVQIGRQLDKAKYRDRIKVSSASVLPPGRLRTRAAVQGAALKSKGIMTQAEPWRRVQHKHVDDPNLTLGVMVDISGSMSGAMEPMSATAWIMSEALHRIQGTGAMVYYGDSVFPTLEPGEHLDQVRVYSASDGSEDFDRGFKALDGKLNLLHGRGARMLVVVSDGQYGAEGQSDAVVKWLQRCRKMGVAVLWIGYGHTQSGYWGNTRGAEFFCEETGASLVKPTGVLTDDALMIGRAAEQALTKAGSRNGD